MLFEQLYIVVFHEIQDLYCVTFVIFSIHCYMISVRSLQIMLQSQPEALAHLKTSTKQMILQNSESNKIL